MPNLQQIKKVAAQLYLNLDNPQSVKRQLQKINAAQKQLQQMKQEVILELKQINQQTKAFGLDEAASMGLHLFGKHRLARQVNRQGKRAEKRKAKTTRQPFLKMRDLIDKYIFESNRLKTMAQNYLKQNHATIEDI